MNDGSVECGVENPDYPGEYYCTFSDGHGRIPTQLFGTTVDWWDHGNPSAGAWWNILKEPQINKVRAQLVGEAAQDALDGIPYDHKLSEANINVLVGEAAIKAMNLPKLNTKREWAVQVRTMIDGDFDKTFTSQNGKPYTEEEARRHVEMWKNHPSGARLVYRDVPDWSTEV